MQVLEGNFQCNFMKVMSNAIVQKQFLINTNLTCGLPYIFLKQGTLKVFLFIAKIDQF